MKSLNLAVKRGGRGAYPAGVCRDGAGDEEEGAGWDKAELMGKIKSYGIAGTLSYIITGAAQTTTGTHGLHIPRRR